MQRKNIYDQVYSHQDLIERCGGKKVPMATAFLVQNPSRADTMWKFNDIHVMSPWKHMKTPWNSEMSPVSTTLGSSYARSDRQGKLKNLEQKLKKSAAETRRNYGDVNQNGIFNDYDGYLGIGDLLYNHKY